MSYLKLNQLNVLKRILLIILFVGFYFIGLRPIRSNVADLIKSKIEVSGVDQFQQSSVGITTVYSDGDFSKKFVFKVPFGMFFLFSSVCLIWLQARWKDFGILILIQLGFWIIAFLSFIPGSNGNLFFLEIMDFLTRYLSPLASLGLPIYIMYRRKIEDSE
jgi:hypothetical protein